MNYEKLREGVNNIKHTNAKRGGEGVNSLRNKGIFFVTKNRKWADNQAPEFLVLFILYFFLESD